MKFRLSKLFWPVVVTPKDAIVKTKLVTSKSQKLMNDLGLVRPVGNGYFHILPIAQKSLDIITNLVNEYFSKANASRVTLPMLTSSSLWKKSGRLDDGLGELFLLKDRHGKEYVLSPTHEESITDLLSMCSPLTYKQLPLKLYQIGQKFRDEIKPRFGLLRAREFMMADLYTFDRDTREAEATYDEINEIYSNLFNALDLPWMKVSGDSGSIGGSKSHEYHIISDTGEDRIATCSSCNFGWNEELYDDNSVCPNCKSKDLTYRKGIEVAHTFLLGEKYSGPLGATFLQENGKPKPLAMGCYGIGVTRMLAACLEVLSKEDELVWPDLLAPFDVCIIPPKKGSKEEASAAKWIDRICAESARICGENFVLLDDRTNLTIGKRLLDAKRMGHPIVLIVGAKSMETTPKLELFHAKDGRSEVLVLEDVLAVLDRYKRQKEERKDQYQFICKEKITL